MAQIAAETAQTTQPEVRGTAFLPSRRRLNHLQSLEAESILLLSFLRNLLSLNSIGGTNAIP
jgi:hypothetical protein